jgi:hypothetical protein
MANVETTPVVEETPFHEAPPAETHGASVEDLAAHDYQTLIPEFYKKIEELSNRSLKRVVTALVEYPLQSKNFQWSYAKERECFNIGMKLFDCKFVLMRAVFDMSKEDIKKLAAELEPKGTEGA